MQRPFTHTLFAGFGLATGRSISWTESMSNLLPRFDSSSHLLSSRLLPWFWNVFHWIVSRDGSKMPAVAAIIFWDNSDQWSYHLWMCFSCLLKSSIGTLTPLQKVSKCRITLSEFSVVFAPEARDLSRKKPGSLPRGDGNASWKGERAWRCESGIALKTRFSKENAWICRWLQRSRSATHLPPDKCGEEFSPTQFQKTPRCHSEHLAAC